MIRSTSLTAIALSIAVPAYADDGAAAPLPVLNAAAMMQEDGTPIIVTGRDDGYRTITTTTGLFGKLFKCSCFLHARWVTDSAAGRRGG